MITGHSANSMFLSCGFHVAVEQVSFYHRRDVIHGSIFAITKNLYV